MFDVVARSRIGTMGPAHIKIATIGAALCLVTAAGCTQAGKRAEPLVRVHAERDLDCPGHNIRIQEELGGRYKAIGCGRKAMYRAACDGLQCEVRDEDDPAIPWRDRPEP